MDASEPLAEARRLLSAKHSRPPFAVHARYIVDRRVFARANRGYLAERGGTASVLHAGTPSNGPQHEAPSPEFLWAFVEDPHHWHVAFFDRRPGLEDLPICAEQRHGERGTRWDGSEVLTQTHVSAASLTLMPDWLADPGLLVDLLDIVSASEGSMVGRRVLSVSARSGWDQATARKRHRLPASNVLFMGELDIETGVPLRLECRVGQEACMVFVAETFEVEPGRPHHMRPGPRGLER